MSFNAAIGYGGLSAHTLAMSQIAAARNSQTRRGCRCTGCHLGPSEAIWFRESSVMGIGDIISKIAGCCHPLPVTTLSVTSPARKGSPSTVQTVTTCSRKRSRSGWFRCSGVPPTSFIPLVCKCSPGPCRAYPDISTLIADEKVNITGMTVAESPDRVTTISLDIETKGLTQLARLISKMEGVKGVTSVSRQGEEARTGRPTCPDPFFCREKSAAIFGNSFSIFSFLLYTSNSWFDWGNVIDSIGFLAWRPRPPAVAYRRRLLDFLPGDPRNSSPVWWAPARRTSARLDRLAQRR